MHNCPCASYYPPGEEFLDDGRSGCCMKVGKSTLLCGPKSRFFPCQLFVGPEWYCMFVTYALIVVLTVFFLVNVATDLGPPVLIIGTVSCAITVILFSATACSDPGIVFNYAAPTLHSTDTDTNNNHNHNHGGRGGDTAGGGERKTDDDGSASVMSAGGVLSTRAIDLQAVEEGAPASIPAPPPPSQPSAGASASLNVPGIPPPRPVRSVGALSSTAITATATATTGAVPKRLSSAAAAGAAARTSMNERRAMSAALAATQTSGRGPNGEVWTMECSICQLYRPATAVHCYECGVCVDGLDHHCPWTGKCIARKNLRTFQMFLGALCFHIVFVVAAFIYAVAAVGAEVVQMHS